MELLSPLTADGVLTPWLRSKAKLYHLAYEAPNLSDHLTSLREQGAKVMAGPVAAQAFGRKQIVFLMLPNMLLVELIET